MPCSGEKAKNPHQSSCASRSDATIGDTITVLVDEPGEARSTREAPEIDGVVQVPDSLPVGTFQTVRVVGALGPDLEAEALG